MERLTECVGFRNGKPIYKTKIDMRKLGAVDNLKDALGRYEDLEEQGKLLKLLCKIGDTIYVIPSEVNFKLNIVNRHEENNRVYEQVVNRIEICKNDYLLSTCDGMTYVSGKSYKKTWFLSYEEAEVALQGYENNYGGQKKMNGLAVKNKKKRKKESSFTATNDF